MEIGTLNVTQRNGKGKTVTRKLRASGKIPGIIYGKGEEPIMLALDPTELLRSLDPEKRANTVITLNLDGGQKVTAMLRDVQRDLLRGHLTHADFLRVNLDQEVHATVPLVIIGKAEGVKLGGTLHQVFRSLEVACTPDKIPTKIEVNVEKLGMGEALHVRDLKLAEGVRPLIDAGQTICTVTAPKAEKVAEAVVEGAAEGAPAAEGAAAAPAAGAAAGAKPEAKAGEKAAPGKGEKEKK